MHAPVCALTEAMGQPFPHYKGIPANTRVLASVPLNAQEVLCSLHDNLDQFGLKAARLPQVLSVFGSLLSRRYHFACASNGVVRHFVGFCGAAGSTRAIFASFCGARSLGPSLIC